MQLISEVAGDDGFVAEDLVYFLGHLFDRRVLDDLGDHPVLGFEVVIDRQQVPGRGKDIFGRYDERAGVRIAEAFNVRVVG